MKCYTYKYSLIKRLGVAARPFGYATRPSHPCPVRPPKNRATPMAVDSPPLPVRMDVDEWWWTPESDVTIDPVISGSGGPSAMDWQPESKGSPTPAPVLRVKAALPPTSGRLNRPKLKPLRARREAVPLVAPSSTIFNASAVKDAGGSGIGTKRPNDALKAHLLSSSQKRVATDMSPSSAPVKVETLERMVRSAQSPATQKAPSPFGSPRLRPRGLEPPTQEGLTEVDNELLSLLGEIDSAPSAPPPQPQLVRESVPVESSAAGQLIPEDARPTRRERPQLKREGVLSEILEEAEEEGLFLEAP
ncbi:hypothetical protein INT43_009140 [Umbelopsis isabellina]|uniref:Uncharacterized protein n=1 Tax=Mortierella isabellina TaxID=91625 RepID=A0A8H7PCP9_MORIS|nr:hypothetical protein INT43_009140 [Umbelopsis isabellina]